MFHGAVDSLVAAMDLEESLAPYGG